MSKEKRLNKFTNQKTTFHFFYSYTNSAYLKIQFIECLWIEQMYFQVALKEKKNILVDFWSINSALTAAPAVFSLSVKLTVRCGHTKRLMGGKKQTQHGQNRKDGAKQPHIHVQACLLSNTSESLPGIALKVELKIQLPPSWTLWIMLHLLSAGSTSCRIGVSDVTVLQTSGPKKQNESMLFVVSMWNHIPTITFPDNDSSYEFLRAFRRTLQSSQSSN